MGSGRSRPYSENIHSNRRGHSNRDGYSSRDDYSNRGSYRHNYIGLRNERRRNPDFSLTSPNIYASETSDAALLRVNRVNQEISKNVVAHHTNEFDITDESARDKTYLVVRRGQGFELTIDFNRPYDKQTDDLRIVFQFGNNPHPSKGTHAEFILSEKDDVGEWAGWVKSANGNSIVLNLVASCKAPVGKWKLNIDVVKKNENGGRDVFRYKHPNPIYILFNPWCKEDSVYLHDENLLKEYVLNEKGTIYIGSAHQITGRPWVFGQFTGDVLDCVIYLLERHMIDRNRGNPVMVSRKISSVVNSNDNNGVLMGNWSGDYEGGVRPTSWTGSEPILSEYYKTKMPVMFGQCWVFSGVVTTVCRALGIPARSVTNFASAHDVNGSTTIDFHFDSNYETLDHADTDSIWNFHVWNDVWMARPLLPPGYGGWQAIDATPQEMSDGIFACGPCPLQAIRQGEINLPHDGPFVFSEVNGDAVYWKVLEDGSKIAILRKSNKIGKFISTSKPNTSLGKTEREDLTDQYKFKEGSEEERAAVRRAQQYVSDVEIEPTPTRKTQPACGNKDSNISKIHYRRRNLPFAHTPVSKGTIQCDENLISQHKTGNIHENMGKVENVGHLQPNEVHLQEMVDTQENVEQLQENVASIQKNAHQSNRLKNTGFLMESGKHHTESNSHLNDNDELQNNNVSHREIIGEIKDRCYSCKRRKEFEEAYSAVRQLIQEMKVQPEKTINSLTVKKYHDFKRLYCKCAIKTFAKQKYSSQGQHPMRVVSHIHHVSQTSKANIKLTYKLSSKSKSKQIKSLTEKQEIPDDSTIVKTSTLPIKQTKRDNKVDQKCASMCSKRKHTPAKTFKETQDQCCSQDISFVINPPPPTRNCSSETKWSATEPVISSPNTSQSTVSNDVEFNLEINKDTFIGDDAVIKLFLKNTTGEARTANGTLSLSSMYYTGVYFKSIKSMKVKDLKIEPHAEAVVDLKVTADEYFPLLTDHCNCKVSRMFAVEETKQSDVDTSEFRFRKPHLTIKAPSSVKKGQKFTVEASFKNPLNMTLTKCELAVEGPGLQRMKVIKQSNLAANATFVASIELIPAKKGCREIVLMYNCVQIYAVTGTHTVEVSE